MTDLLIFRAALLAVLSGAAWAMRPFGLDAPLAAGAGLAIGIAVIIAELRLSSAAGSPLTNGAIGALIGVAGAYLISLILGMAMKDAGYLQIAALACLAFLGFQAGSRYTGRSPSAEPAPRQQSKILDTSVIIDGRIADLAETGFIEGTLVVPQFVLRELQLVADSPDTLRRNRGRRGLDILHKMQKNPELAIRIVEDDFANIRDVDMKLVELAKLFRCPVLTNDFNLNKVATLHGVEVLNINELAGALRPVVLPGETMKVFILKEGKEYNQGVAYLDDGTMVVVDNAKKQISRTIEITVTSVLQTTAGKMIFGRFDERVHASEKTAERAKTTIEL